MNYKDIDKVNSEIKMLDLKGKNYAMVPERVTAFRKLFPEGFIETEIIHLSDDGSIVTMKTTAGYYREDGTRVVLSSGMAQEVRGRGMVNGTSYIENCETSAVGRALGMIGLGINGGGICSAEELANAVTAQAQMKQDKPKVDESIPKQPRKPINANVTTTDAIPKNPVQEFIRESVNVIKAEYPDFNFMKVRKELIDANILDDIPSAKMTMDEAAQMIDLISQAVRK